MNDNSSRFAKFTKIVFERFSAFEGRSRNVAKQLREAANIPIVGSVIQTYLLEKSRVIFQDNGEMNFHMYVDMTVCCSSFCFCCFFQRFLKI